MNALETKLQKLGEELSSGIVTGDAVAVKAEPFVDALFPQYANLFNTVTNGAAQAITAAKSAYNPAATDVDNMVAVATAVEPIVIAHATQSGVSAPKTSKIMLYAKMAIAGFKLL
jgi:hypothetical protein